ncbi:MAG: hypothetical protein AVDCRST_MAG19-4442 [uncultured Thermomicrobiales bacterium]|uniref:Uncharacterized protein n=1 Tax=uncultured Thermomicrobiales bacterium TaxID=1645740 RepID=A0A6J4VQI8_9BACT|nr:MAG: hypothetical protein AVDCRST_MAG19-4442 [uncultured Thermomicrobiales bacterium]
MSNPGGRTRGGKPRAATKPGSGTLNARAVGGAAGAIQNVIGGVRLRPEPVAIARDVLNPATWQNGLA